MTEQQPYEVAERRDVFELRRYPAHLVAEIEVAGSFDEAPNRAFRPLASYINGAKRSRRRIATTAPVTQQAGPETIAMTAPVLQQAAGQPGRYLVQFVMPSHLTAETLPVPRDARVRTREIPWQLAAAAVRFSGRWTHTAFEGRAAALRRAVAAAGLRPVGPIRYARFNPPWTPWFARRNEVVLPVEE
jgi:SOUL heme-binding protein